MAEGAVYVEVEAGVANSGISTLSVSGNVNDGSEDSKYWLLWQYDTTGGTYNSGGFTGISWYWDDPNSYVATGWEQSGLGDGTWEGFKQYLINTPNLPNLDPILKDWPDEIKSLFLESHKSNPEFTLCYTFINPN